MITDDGDIKVGQEWVGRISVVGMFLNDTQKSHCTSAMLNGVSRLSGNTNAKPILLWPINFVPMRTTKRWNKFISSNSLARMSIQEMIFL